MTSGSRLSRGPWWDPRQPTTTKPVPTRRAALADIITAPPIPSSPPRISTRPLLCLWIEPSNFAAADASHLKIDLLGQLKKYFLSMSRSPNNFRPENSRAFPVNKPCFKVIKQMVSEALTALGVPFFSSMNPVSESMPVGTSRATTKPL